MKIYLLILGLLLCAGAKAQVVRDDQIVLKTDVSGKTLAQILDIIEQQTPYSFIYDAAGDRPFGSCLRKLGRKKPVRPFISSI